MKQPLEFKSDGGIYAVYLFPCPLYVTAMQLVFILLSWEHFKYF
jgi:hypothetical protein